MFERHQVIQQKNTFAGEEFPDCIAPSPLFGGNDVTVWRAVADDFTPVRVLRVYEDSLFNKKIKLFEIL